MGTTAEKLQAVLTAKNAIRDAIIGKGGEITASTPLSQYADAITAIPSGGGGYNLTVVRNYASGVNTSAVVTLTLTTAAGASFSFTDFTHPDSTWSTTVPGVVSVDIHRTDKYGWATLNGTSLFPSGRVNTAHADLSGDSTLSFSFEQSCLVSGTAIATPSGSVPVDSLKTGDAVLSLDPEKGVITPDEVVYCNSDSVQTAERWTRWEFSDGTVVGTAGRHRFFNVGLGEFMYLEAWLDGEYAVRSDGVRVCLVGKTVVEEPIQHYTLFTKRWNNYFAGGLLCGNRQSSKVERIVSK